jgi:pyruvate dehydrogenase E2 component (dihydrolipoamide acetyltransferase)
MIISIPEIWDYKKYGPGVVAAWFKKEGSIVKKDDLLCHIMVVKVTYEVRAPVSGRVVKIVAPKGSKVKPGDPLIDIEETAEVITVIPEAKPAEKALPSETIIRATPAAKRLARELGIDLSTVTGTGPGGLITEEDVKRYREAIPAYKAKELSGLRKIIADRMMESMKNSAQVTLHMEADVTELVNMYEKDLKNKDITYTALIVKAVSQALQEHPYMNAHIVNDEIRIFNRINIGVAVAIEQGLLVPVIKDADKKSLSQISNEIKELSSLAKKEGLTPDQLTGSTFTITNLGMYGIDYFTPIINPPEIAILGIGRISDKLYYENKEIKVRKVITLSLTFDHRAVDGAPAAEFLAKIASILTNPGQKLKLE